MPAKSGGFPARPSRNPIPEGRARSSEATPDGPTASPLPLQGTFPRETQKASPAPRQTRKVRRKVQQPRCTPPAPGDRTPPPTCFLHGTLRQDERKVCERRKIVPSRAKAVIRPPHFVQLVIPLEELRDLFHADPLVGEGTQSSADVETNRLNRRPSVNPTVRPEFPQNLVIRKFSDVVRSRCQPLEINVFPCVQLPCDFLRTLHAPLLRNLGFRRHRRDCRCVRDASRGGPRGIGANDQLPFKMVVSRTGGRKRRRPGAARAVDDESQLPKPHGERREVAVRRDQDESFHVAVEGVRAVGCRRRSGPRGEGAEKAPLEIPMTKRDFLRESARKTPQLPSWRKRPVPPSSQDPTPIRCGPRGLQFLLFPFRP